MLRNHQSYLDGVFDGLIRGVNRLIRQVITDHLMTLHLSSTEVLRLGRDLTGTFPQVLEQIDNARLREMLVRIDVTLDSLKQSGAKDWADFTIVCTSWRTSFAFTRSSSICSMRQFMTQQVTLLKSGVRPDGRL